MEFLRKQREEGCELFLIIEGGALHRFLTRGPQFGRSFVGTYVPIFMFSRS